MMRMVTGFAHLLLLNKARRVTAHEIQQMCRVYGLSWVACLTANTVAACCLDEGSNCTFLR